MAMTSYLLYTDVPFGDRSSTFKTWILLLNLTYATPSSDTHELIHSSGDDRQKQVRIAEMNGVRYRPHKRRHVHPPGTKSA
jgi:hypothetical protein